MAKKIVRGITDVKTINNQDFDTNNVNDLLSDGQYNYIHRKKGKNEEYHNLTDNIKTISSDNTELLSVTNNNKTTNTATLHPKHDAQKEQLLESTRDTITINHGTNGTPEKTTVDTNPQKVLEHENLLTGYGISKNTTGNTTKLGLEYTQVDRGYDLNNLVNGCIRAVGLVNAPKENTWYFVSAYSENMYTIQEAVTLVDNENTTYRRLKRAGVWGEWREQVGDKSVIDALLAQKQDVLTAGDGITIEGQTVDTNPLKVLEHENLISDSEYITLNHQTGENTTHIQTAALEQELTNLHQTKQDTLVAGSGITIQGQTISATGGAHDSQKEQVIESTRNTVTIHHGTNGTAEKTTVDTNPQKVLEHENLLTINGISKTTTENVTTIGLKTIDNYSGDLNELTETCLVRPTDNAVNLPFVNGEGILTVVKVGDTVSQQYHDIINNAVYIRSGGYVQGAWRWSEWTRVGGSISPS